MKESDFENKSSEEIVDGLVNKYDGDEELALRELKTYLADKEDGYFDRDSEIMQAKDKLEKMVESKNIFKLKEFSTRFGKTISEIVNTHLKTYKDLYEGKEADAFFDTYKGLYNLDEVYAFIDEEINPNVKYKSVPFRYIDGNGDKHVIQITGISTNAEKGIKTPRKILYKELSYKINNDADEPNLVRSEIKEMSISDFKNIMNNNYNQVWLNDVVLKKQSRNPEDWMHHAVEGEYRLRKKTDDFYNLWKDELDLYDLETQNLIFELMEKNSDYTIDDAITILKNRGKLKYKDGSKPEEIDTDNNEKVDNIESEVDDIKNESTLEEAAPKRNQDRVENELKKLGLRTAIAATASIEGFTEPSLKTKWGNVYPDKKYEILDILNDGKRFVAYVRELKKGAKYEEWSLKRLVDVLSIPQNQKSLPDIWEMASDPRIWNNRLRSGNTGEYVSIPEEIIIDILNTEQGDNPDVTGVDLKKYYKPNDKTNRVISNILRKNMPGVALRRTGKDYKMFVPKDNMTQADAPKHHGQNPYEKVIKYGA